MIKVAILAPSSVQLLDVAGPIDVFTGATAVLGDGRGYDVKVVGVEPGPIRTAAGLTIYSDLLLDDATEQFDTVLVAGTPILRSVIRNRRADAWVRRQAEGARRTASVCSGAFVLANAGLLDGRRATTHWRLTEQLARLWPSITVEPDAIYVCDGPICTSAGVSAGMDLALAMVEQDFGRDVALMVARELVMFLKRPGGQSQFSAHLAAQTAVRTPIEQTQAHILANLDSDLRVNALAARTAMSPRNFARVFTQEAGMTPHAFVETARLDAARRMLEEADTSLQAVATRTGFREVDTLRRAFVRKLGVTPSEYRERFRAAEPPKPGRASSSDAPRRSRAAPRGDG